VSTILLVRHGQASFGQEDYDVLSPRGETQAARLGAHFAAIGQRVDAIYVGPRKRQRDTAAIMARAARERGALWPTPVERTELDEYPAELLIRQNFAALVANDPDFARALDPATPPAERGAAFERLFAHAMARWMNDALDTTGLESFGGFIARVQAVLDDIVRSEGRGKQILVVSSAGTISAALGLVLGTPPEVTLRLGYVMANTAVNAIKYRDPRELTLISFNALPHLADDAGLVTYR
jgi:broad specificity phosphatase PhoE